MMYVKMNLYLLVVKKHNHIFIAHGLSKCYNVWYGYDSSLHSTTYDAFFAGLGFLSH